ncbi:MAG: hypothetical protein GAK45_00367 [Pseudomonas citronellolis]|nr:MAG: hypothetical protein GAK45_00367 [Pseudomonas citronellolis]
MTARFAAALLACLLSPFAQAATAPSTSPAKAVVAFYQWYLHNDAGWDSPQMPQYATGTLLEAIRHETDCNYDPPEGPLSAEAERQCQRRICEQIQRYVRCYRDGIPIETDVDYFIKAQDYPESWPRHIFAGLVIQKGTRAQVSLTLGDGSEAVQRLWVTIAVHEGMWKIERVDPQSQSKP